MISLESIDKYITAVRDAWSGHQDVDALDDLPLAGYLRSTCFSLINRHANGYLWQVSIPHMASVNVFLHDGILALSALHTKVEKSLQGRSLATITWQSLRQLASPRR